MSHSEHQATGMTPLRRALLKLEELQATIDSLERARREPLAIVGVACRFPGGGSTPDAFWHLLVAGSDAVGEIPPDRWDVDAYYDPTPGVPGRMYTRHGAFLHDIDRFDARMFGIAPREAVGMDPQQRLLLEVVWEALENAGIAPDRLTDSATGVFVGICRSDYAQLQVRLADPTRFDAYYGSGSAHSIASGRVSYVLGLKGPSISVDTACSSSLVALHLAGQSLRSGECRMALVGGVNLILSPENTLTFCQSTMVSRDGRCRTFDAEADGFGQGEGCGVIVLKRLSDALADGDRVHALVLGTAVNQDGPSSGLTAPNGPSQEAMLRAALAASGVAPRQVGYIEAHGTGTALGDPIEVQALGAVLREGRAPTQPALIGSVKTNVGHLEAAAGIAGVIKVVLALQHRVIPPHLHFRTPNPHIPWDDLPLEVAATRREWTPIEGRRVAGVSSFGFSGTNAHVVLEEAPPPAAPPEGAERDVHIFTCSARSETARAETARRYLRWLDDHPDARLADVCHTANVGRADLPYRTALVVDSVGGLRARLRAVAEGSADADVLGFVDSPDRPKVGFLFTGQGSQYPGMGRTLFEHEPVFRAALLRCDEILRPHLPQPLLSVIYPESTAHDAAALLDQTAFTQPALFALEYALAELWRSWGVSPTHVLGHSVGEYVAACVAGVFSLEAGLTLIARRAQLMQSLPAGGGMAAVFAEESRVQEAIAGWPAELAIAAVNGPEHVVISGDGAALAAVLELLQKQGIRSKSLNVSHAFHSPLMTPIAEDFERAAAEVTYAAPRVTLISNVTGRRVSRTEMADPRYWRRHMLQPVRFSESIRNLRGLGCDCLVEIGPDPVLLGMIARSTDEPPALSLPSLRRGHGDALRMFTSLGALYLRGVEIDWHGVDRGRNRRRLALPTYPFERDRYWVEGLSRVAGPGVVRSVPDRRVSALLGEKVETARGIVFTLTISTDSMPFTRDHVVHGLTVLPTTAYLEIARAAGCAVLGTEAVTIQELSLQHALRVRAEPSTLQVLVAPQDERTAAFEIFSRAGEENGASQWTLHASGTLQSGASILDRPGGDPARVQERCPVEVPADVFYAGLWQRGLQFGAGFQCIERLRRRDGEAIGEVQLAQTLHHEAESYGLHPALLDGCLQVLAAAAPGFNPADATADIYMPIAVEHFACRAGSRDGLSSHGWFEPASNARPETRVGHVRVFDGSGQCVASVGGIQMKRVDRQTLARVLGAETNDWFYRIDWRPADGPTPADGSRASDLASALQGRFAVLSRTHELDAQGAADTEFDALAAAYIVVALRRLGWTFRPGERVATDALAQQLGVVDRYQRLLARFLEILGEEGYLASTAAGWIVCADPGTPDVDRLHRTLAERYPARAEELEITGRCGARLADVLRGAADPLGLLFPGGDVDATARIYNATPVARTFNALCAEAVRSELKRLSRGRPVRILEIGAGTGGTTDFVLGEIPDSGVEYVFTDIGQVFLTRAARRYADRPFMQYRLLDIESDPVAQGLAAGAFDIVIASNVLHATADVRTALEHVRRLLDPSGVLLLLEGTKPHRWFDLTFGLTDGWWRFRDHGLRPSHPLMAREQWLEVLGRCGFVPSAVPSDPGCHDGSGHMLFLARAFQAEAPAAEAARADWWLVLADRSGAARELTERLRADGSEVVTVACGPAYSAVRADLYTVDPDAPDDVLRAVREAGEARRGRRCRGGVHLWALDECEEPIDAASLSSSERRGCGAALRLAQALLQIGHTEPPSLWLVTRGAQSAGVGARSVCGASMWGLARVIGLEHPELRCTRVDLDPEEPGGSAEAIDRLVREIRSDGADAEVAFRDTRRYVARLVRAELRHSSSGPASSAAADPVELVLAVQGSPDTLGVRRAVRRAPGRGEVEVQVHAAGLNFRDVLNVLGMRRDPEPLGGECAGVVTRLGPGVDGFEVGDEVLAIATGAFASYAVVRAELTCRKPPRLSFERAAGVPLAFLTAHHALHAVGGITAGARVLIHAAAGGVGLAAVATARRAGAEVFATAGNAEKRAYLESIGVGHVMDSRSTAFAEEVMQATDGEGVDIVLNSLTGDAIPRSLSVLRPGGRFVEIGKAELWDVDRVAAINPDVRYVPVDVAGLLHRDPASLRPLFLELVEDVAAGRLDQPPVTTFDLASAAEAFRYMARARHIGKVVLLPPRPHRRAGRDPGVPFAFRGDATYLVTGAYGGLGLAVVRWMAERGARYFALVGRRSPSPEAEQLFETLRAGGARVLTMTADVAEPQPVEEVFARIARELPPLRGVVHAAGVLRDGALLQQDWTRFAEVLAPKVLGGWNLHRLTREVPLDFFVLFSSVSSLLGSPGQSNHGAANAFLDQLAHYRRAKGLPATSINWGAWTAIGAAAARGVDERIAAHGVGAFSPEQGLDAFERILRSDVVQVGVMPIDWEVFTREFLRGKVPGYLTEVAAATRAPRTTATAQATSVADLRAQLAEALPAKRGQVLLAHVEQRARRVLGLPADRAVDRRIPLAEMGLDSLMAIELRNTLAAAVGTTLPATLLFDHPTVDAVAAFLATEVLGLDEPRPEPAGGVVLADEAAVLELIEQLSDDEVDRLLLERQGRE